MSNESNPYASPAHRPVALPPDRPAGEIEPRTSVEYQFTEEDYLKLADFRYANLTTINRFIRRRQVVLGVVAIVLVAMAMGGFRVGGELDAIAVGFLCGAAISLILVVRLPRTIRKNLRRQAKTLLNEGNNCGVFGKHRVTIQDEGLFSESDTGYQLFRWRAVDRLERNDDYLFVFLPAMQAQPIPARVFGTAGDFHAFGDLIQRRIAEHADEHRM